MFRNPSTWKLYLTYLVTSLVLFLTVLDFIDPTVPNWNIFDTIPSTTEAYGAKAALLAMAGGALLFIGLMPVHPSKFGRRLDLGVKIAGSLTVSITGWFWLLSATNGHVGPYLAAIIPTIALCLIFTICAIAFSYAQSVDNEQIREHGRARIRIDAIGLGILVVGIAAIVMYLLVNVPGWLF